MLFRSLGKYEKAIVFYEKSLETEPNDETALCNKGESLFKLKKFSEAQNVIKKVLELNPNDKEATELLDKINKELSN